MRSEFQVQGIGRRYTTLANLMRHVDIGDKSLFHSLGSTNFISVREFFRDASFDDLWAALNAGLTPTKPSESAAIQMPSSPFELLLPASYHVKTYLQAVS